MVLFSICLYDIKVDDLLSAELQEAFFPLYEGFMLLKRLNVVGMELNH